LRHPCLSRLRVATGAIGIVRLADRRHGAVTRRIYGALLEIILSPACAPFRSALRGEDAIDRASRAKRGAIVQLLSYRGVDFTC